MNKNWSEMTYYEQRKLLGLENVAWYVTQYQVKKVFKDFSEAWKQAFGGVSK